MSTQITINRYNTIQAAINEILGTGATGYGQVLKSSQLSIPSGTSRLIYAQDVNNLVADLRRILQHQDGVDYSTNIPTVTADTTKAAETTYANLETYLAQATTNRWKMSGDASQSATVTGVTTQRTTNWNSEIYHEAVANFSSELNAKYFFNAGGELIVSTSMTGHSGDKSNAWAQMLNSVGNVTMNYTTTSTGTSVSQIGFNDLTSAYQLLYSGACSAPYTTNTYTVFAKKDGQFVHFKMTYTDAVSGTPDELINGTITSTVKYRGAVGASVVAPVPTITTLNGLDSGGVSQGYTVLLSPNSVSEGNDIHVTISSYPPVASVWYEITGDGPGVTVDDFDDGKVKESKTLTNGGIQFNKAVAVDVLSDSSNVTMKLYDKDPAIPGAVLLKTSNTILINDGNLDLTLSLVSPLTPVLDESSNNIGNFAVVGTGLPATTTATWTATGTGATHLTKTTDTFTISGGSGTFAVTVSPDHKTTGDLPVQVKVSIGAIQSNTIDLTINDTSKPIITYHSTKDPDFGLSAFTYDADLYFTITGGPPGGTFTFTRDTNETPVTYTLGNTGLFPHGSFDNKIAALTSPGTLHTKIVFAGESHDYLHDIAFTNDVQEITISSIPPDITSGKTLQIDFSLSKCYTPAIIIWELIAPIPAGIYRSGSTETSGTITTAGTTGTGTGSLILQADVATVVKGTSFTVKFTLSTLTTINATTSAIRIIDAFPYTTNVDAQVFLPTLASAVTIKARGGAGGGGGRDGSNGDGGDGASANTIITKEPVGSVRTLSAVIGKGGNPGTSNATSAGGGLGGTGYKKGGDGGAVRNDNYSGGGAGGGGATAVIADTTELVVAGGGGGGGGGSSARDGIDATGTNTTVTVLTGTDGIAGDGGGSGDGGGAGGSGGFVTTIGTNLKGADSSRSATAGTSGNIAYDNSQPAVTGTPFVINTNTGGLGATTKITGTAGLDGEVTIYVQPMAPQYSVAALQSGLPGSSEIYYVNSDAPLKDGSAEVISYTTTASSPANGVITRTGTLPMIGFNFNVDQHPAFKLAANNVFGKGVEIAVPVQTQKFSISDTIFPGAKYSKSCAISGDGNYLVVGAPLVDQLGALNFEVHKRTGNRWTLMASSLIMADPWASGDQLGYSVDINAIGDRIVVGAPYRDYNSEVDQGGTYIYKRTGESWDQEVFIPDPNTNGNQYDYAGFSVVMSNDGSMILVGAPGGDVATATGTIVAYYAESNSWSTVTFADRVGISTGAGEANALHGSALSISSNMLVCVEGAPGDANQGWYSSSATGISNAGYVGLHTRTGTTSKSWSLKKGFYSPTPIADGNFGTSIALNSDGTILVVGAPGESAFGLAKAGAVHVFAGSGTTWDIQAKLMASDAQACANFGTSVTINDAGTTILVGANNATAGGRTGSGIVYKFVKSGTTWIQDAIITPYDKAATDAFGTSVSLNSTGDLAVIGAPNTNPLKAGAAYTFQLGSYVADDPYWDKVSLLVTADNGAQGSNTFVDLSNNSLPLTANSAVVIDTAIKKFGTGSMYIPNVAGNVISTPLTSLLDLNGGAFTVEAWIYPTRFDVNDHGCIIICDTWELAVDKASNNGRLTFYYTNTAAVYGPNVPLNQWSHVAAVYDGVKLTLYVNGVSGTAATIPGLTANVNVNQIGGHGTWQYTGYIDELRVTKGVARYSGTFTPPTATFTPTFTFQP
jgi:hypothetical protein